MRYLIRLKNVKSHSLRHLSHFHFFLHRHETKAEPTRAFTGRRGDVGISDVLQKSDRGCWILSDDSKTLSGVCRGDFELAVLDILFIGS